MRRPVPATNTTAGGPIVLTLGSDGLYYPAPASLLIKAESTAAAALAGPNNTALVATTLPAAETGTLASSSSAYSAFRSYCSPMVAGLPTVTTARDADDVSFYVSLLSSHSIFLDAGSLPPPPPPHPCTSFFFLISFSPFPSHFSSSLILLHCHFPFCIPSFCAYFVDHLPRLLSR